VMGETRETRERWGAAPDPAKGTIAPLDPRGKCSHTIRLKMIERHKYLCRFFIPLQGIVTLNTRDCLGDLERFRGLQTDLQHGCR